MPWLAGRAWGILERGKERLVVEFVDSMVCGSRCVGVGGVSRSCWFMGG